MFQNMLIKGQADILRFIPKYIGLRAEGADFAFQVAAKEVGLSFTTCQW